MDCPRYLISRLSSFILLTIFCLICQAGCALWKNETTTEPSSLSQIPANAKKEEPPKRTPQPSTCVAFASFHAKAANEPDRPAPQCDYARGQAYRAYQQALALDPKCIPAYLGLGQLLQDMGKFAEAEKIYKKGLEIQPREGSLYFGLGVCQARQKNWDKALASLKTATEIDPKNRDYSTTLGFSLARVGRYDESFECFQQSVGVSKAHYNVARALHHVQRDEQSKEHLRQAIQENPEFLQAKEMLAQLEQPNQKPESIPAVENLEEANLTAAPPARNPAEMAGHAN